MVKLINLFFELKFSYKHKKNIKIKIYLNNKSHTVCLISIGKFDCVCFLHTQLHIRFSYSLNLLLAIHLHIASTVMHLMPLHKFSASINVARAAGADREMGKSEHIKLNIYICKVQ